MRLVARIMVIALGMCAVAWPARIIEREKYHALVVDEQNVGSLLHPIVPVRLTTVSEVGLEMRLIGYLLQWQVCEHPACDLGLPPDLDLGQIVCEMMKEHCTAIAACQHHQARAARSV